MRKINILFLLPQAKQGGTETQLLNLLKGIDKNKFTISLGLLYNNNQLKKEFENINNINIVYFSKINKWDLFVFRKINRFIKENHIDIIHSFLGIHNSYIPSIFSSKCISVGSIRSTYYNKYNLLDNLTRFLIPKLLTNFNNLVLVSNSKTGKKLYLKKGFTDKSIVVIPNGIDFKKYSTGKKEKIVKEFNLNNKFVLGMVSRLEEKKNHAMLFNIMDELIVDFKNLILLIVGEGPNFLNLKKHVKEKKLDNYIIFLGNRKDVQDILCAMDLFVFPSLFPEGWPNVIGEAMSAKLPIISFTKGDIKYIIKDNYDGILIKENVKVFKDKIIELIKNKKKRKLLGYNAKDTIKNKYQFKKMVEEYEFFYLNLFNEKQHKGDKN
jgi:L-malate glycosyltransferase